MAFDSFVYTSAPLVALELAWTTSAQLSLSGLVGHPHRIEYLPSLPASATNPWQTLTNLILPSSPYLIADPESPSAAQRYYRALLLP